LLAQAERVSAANRSMAGRKNMGGQDLSWLPNSYPSMVNGI
jgi:hypothetical protein